MFGRRKKPSLPAFDHTGMTPVIRASICTGEQVAGFREKNGRFHEILCIRSDSDLEGFLKEYGIPPDQLRRDW